MRCDKLTCFYIAAKSFKNVSSFCFISYRKVSVRAAKTQVDRAICRLGYIRYIRYILVRATGVPHKLVIFGFMAKVHGG